jgi:hypothetical protein
MDANAQSDDRRDAEAEAAAEHADYAEYAEHTEHEAPGAGPAPENAVRAAGEIGGKRFRVGLDDAYVPFRNRTKRRRRTIAVALGGLLVLGVGAYGLVNLVTAPAQNAAAACRAEDPAHAMAMQEKARAAAEASAAAAGPKFTLNVYNSTTRHGLAANTAAELKARGFVIGQVTNDPLKANLSVSAQVRGGKASAAELREVAAEVAGAQIQTDGRNDPSVDLVLGTGFTALASVQQVNATLQTANAQSSAGANAAQCAH